MEPWKQAERKRDIIVCGWLAVASGILFLGLFFQGGITDAHNAKQIFRELDYKGVGEIDSVKNWNVLYEMMISPGVRITVIYEPIGVAESERRIDELAQKLKSIDGISCSQEAEYFYSCRKNDLTINLMRSNEVGGVKLTVLKGHSEL